MNNSDTIAAISTPPGEGGISIVRVSGADALSVVGKIFEGQTAPAQSVSHRALHGAILDPETRDRLDEVLLVVMRGPHTYTTEDVLEINCHGGDFVAGRILEAVLHCGARLAEPGEFTRRAFLNGRIDLAQAEAVLDVIRSRTAAGLRASQGQLSGRLSQVIHQARKQMVSIVAELEAAVDFPEDCPAAAQGDRLVAATQGIADGLQELIDSSVAGKMIRQGATLVIAGKPNVGKSSLLNALLGENRAIVSPTPGTTRDTIVEGWVLAGMALQLIDTAGIGCPRDAVEEEGGRRAEEYLGKADMVLFVLDGSEPLGEQDFAIAGLLAGTRHISAINKTDLKQHIEIGRLRAMLPGPVVEISALQGLGLEELTETIAKELLGGHHSLTEGVMVTHLRHRQALERSRDALLRAVEAMNAGLSEEFVALEMSEALVAIGEITGETSQDEILESIFSQFCIGK